MPSTPQTNTFDDEGRIPQLEFAIKNVSKAGTSLAFKCQSGVILIGICKDLNEHVEKRLEKIYKIDKNIFCVLSGLFADGLQLISLARQYAQNYLYDFNTEIPLQFLVKQISKNLQHFTHMGGMRPFGVSILFVTKNCIMSTDPAGSCNEWRGKAFGLKEEAVNSEINGLSNEMGFDEAVVELFRVLGMKQEISEKKAVAYEVMFCGEEGGRLLSVEEVKGVVGRVKMSVSE